MPLLPPIWPEGNVTFDYLSTLNRWAKRFNFLLLRGVVPLTRCRKSGSGRQYSFEN